MILIRATKALVIFELLQLKTDRGISIPGIELALFVKTRPPIRIAVHRQLQQEAVQVDVTSWAQALPGKYKLICLQELQQGHLHVAVSDLDAELVRTHFAVPLRCTRQPKDMGGPQCS